MQVTITYLVHSQIHFYQTTQVPNSATLNDIIKRCTKFNSDLPGLSDNTVFEIQGRTFTSKHKNVKIADIIKKKEGRPIHIHIIYRERNNGGGDMNAFGRLTFNSTENETEIKFKETAPRWRVVSKGINLEGRCKNANCDAAKSKNTVWVNKGMGKFNINKEAQITKCPICSSYLTNVDNFGYYNCRVHLEGVIDGDERVIEKDFEHSGNTEMKTFKSGDEENRKWVYLELTARQI